jgi:hypothetical protein
VKANKLFWGLLAIWFLLLGVWLWQGVVYPHTIYDCHRTDEVIDRYMDRASGYRVVAIPVWEPDNPAWVDVIRKRGPITLFVVAGAVLWALTEYPERKRSRKTD